MPGGSLGPQGISQTTQGPSCNGQVSVRIAGGTAGGSHPVRRPTVLLCVCSCAGCIVWLTPPFTSLPGGPASWVTNTQTAWRCRLLDRGKPRWGDSGGRQVGGCGAAGSVLADWEPPRPDLAHWLGMNSSKLLQAVAIPCSLTTHCRHLVSSGRAGGSSWSTADIFTLSSGRRVFVKTARGRGAASMFQGEAEGLRAMHGEQQLGGCAGWQGSTRLGPGCGLAGGCIPWLHGSGWQL